MHADVAQTVEYYQEGVSPKKELLQVKSRRVKKYLRHILDRI